MEKVGSIAQREANTLKAATDTINAIRRAVEDDVTTLSGALNTLQKIRADAYENLNQIQHEALLLKGISHLKDQPQFADAAIEWYWHPRQTSGAGQADIQAKMPDNIIVVSAEATTSLKPIGTIRQRMINTLRQLQIMSGERYYFVSSLAMEEAANKFIDTTRDTHLPLTISVVRLA